MTRPDPSRPLDPAAGLLATDVWLERDGRAVLRGASLHVPPGAVTALIAPSGAGKSTLLRCLNGLLVPDRGRITLGGVPIGAVPPRQLRQQVGLVSQTPVMLPGTVAENLAYGMRDAPSDGAMHDALVQVGLGDAFAPRDASALSGGERARVALARAMVRRPVALILDEPTAALDAAVGLQVGETLRDLAAQGVAVCLAIHDVPFARQVADRLVDLTGTPIADGAGDTPPAPGDGADR